MRCFKLHAPSCVGLVNVRRCVDFFFPASIIFFWTLINFDEENIFYEQIIASENETVRWTTPLGLPVVQPYQQMGSKLVCLPKS